MSYIIFYTSLFILFGSIFCINKLEAMKEELLREHNHRLIQAIEKELQ